MVLNGLQTKVLDAVWDFIRASFLEVQARSSLLEFLEIFSSLDPSETLTTGVIVDLNAKLGASGSSLNFDSAFALCKACLRFCLVCFKVTAGLHVCIRVHVRAARKQLRRVAGKAS